MVRSLGLTAYQAIAGRKKPRSDAPTAPRPTGELVWIHAAESGNMIAILDLAARLCSGRLGLSVLVTLPEGAELPAQPPHPEHIILQQPTPGEHPQTVAGFLDHWQPDLCLWVWGRLRPNLILEAHARGCGLMLVDADVQGFDGQRDRWLPDVTTGLLEKFSNVIARSEAAKKRLMQLGLSRDAIRVESPLQAGGQALPCRDSDLSDLSDMLAARPVWFAAKLQPAEVAVVLRAHRQAMRLSHRLLLILNPAEPAQAAEIAMTAADDGFDVVHWDEGSAPDDTTQVMVAEDHSERGLFFRIAPVSFLGSSLVPDKGGCDPFEAAALGSAVLYGPKVRQFMPSYSRLAAAGAARIVNDSTALGTAVSRLIAPDQAAAMAHAGWDVISTGAELMDMVADLVQDTLDRRLSKAASAP